MSRVGTLNGAWGPLWGDLVWEAVRGKYRGLTRRMVLEVMAGRGSEQRLPEAFQDVRRQIVVLKRIESEWRHRALSRRVVMELYGEIYGIATEQVHWRTGVVTLENGFVTPVPPAEIEKQMELYWHLLNKASVLRGSGSLDRLIRVAGEIFWRLILVHPFPDGNGRTARMMVNLALRRWGLPYVTISKVRNSSKWRAALESAMAGKPEALSRELEQLVLDSLERIEFWSARGKKAGKRREMIV